MPRARDLVAMCANQEVECALQEFDSRLLPF